MSARPAATVPTMGALATCRSALMPAAFAARKRRAGDCPVSREMNPAEADALYAACTLGRLLLERDERFDESVKPARARLEMHCCERYLSHQRSV